MNIKTLCLGILALGDASGYEIRKLVDDGQFSFFSDASYGSIYPALTKLTEDGMVTYRSESQDGRPDKKVYQLTPMGRSHLEETLDKDPAPDKNKSDFLASLLFAEAVHPDRLDEMIAERVSAHAAQVKDLDARHRASLQEADSTPMTRFVLGYSLAVQRAAHSYLQGWKRSTT